MGAALRIRDELTPEALRRRARPEPNRRAALRMLAVAHALEGMSRAEAARLWSGKPCATPWSATTLRGWPGSMIGPSRVDPSG
jgi:hypothetical protein